MIYTSDDMTECTIHGTKEDWQILWTNNLDGETLIGMTEKMKEQLCWCYCYVREYAPDSDRIIPLGLDVFQRGEAHTHLIFTMIDRRLRGTSDIKTTPCPSCYYTWRVPFSVRVPPAQDLWVRILQTDHSSKLKIQIRTALFPPR